MNLQKAFEIIQAIIDTGEYEGEPDDSDALKLGLQALERCIRLRSDKHCSPTKLLPGETED